MKKGFVYLLVLLAILSLDTVSYGSEIGRNYFGDYYPLTQYNLNPALRLSGM
jgi:hypothetical protein